MRNSYRTGILNNMRSLAAFYGVNLDDTQLQSDVTAITNLELALAFNFTTDDVTRRQQGRNYNPFSTSSAQSAFPILNWKTLLTTTSALAETAVQDLLLADTYTFFIMEPTQLRKLQEALQTGFFTSRQVVNYLFYRIVDAYYPEDVSLLSHPIAAAHLETTQRIPPSPRPGHQSASSPSTKRR